MAVHKSNRKKLDDLLEKLEPEVAAAFAAGVAEIVKNADAKLIAELLSQGRVNEAFDTMQINNATFRAMERQLELAFMEAGEATLGGGALSKKLTGGRAVITFGARNLAAERFLNQTSIFITEIVADQRTGIREFLTEGLARGANPKSTALDLVGRIDPRTKKRVGGVVGLQSKQIQTISNAKLNLTSGDPALMNKYLSLKLRDKRFDKIVLKSIRDGEAISEAKASQLMTSYSNRALKYRAETIARTETLGALSQAQHAGFELMVAGGVEAKKIKKVWRTATDARVRDSHADLEGETVGIDERFSNGLLYPREAGGAAEDVINCRCDVVYEVDYLAGLE